MDPLQLRIQCYAMAVTVFQGKVKPSQIIPSAPQNMSERTRAHLERRERDETAKQAHAFRDITRMARSFEEAILEAEKKSPILTPER